MSLIRGDARHIPLRDGCVDCVVTSPPYWGLRDYGAPGQLGLEPTPAAYVAAMVGVFREVRRVLKTEGIVWLNLGDSYNSAASNQNGFGLDGKVRGGNVERGRQTGIDETLKPKDLVGIPWRVAFALQADGWYLRSDVIWAKPNPMPESVIDRPTKSHEYLFLLAKSERYFYDAESIKEPSTHSESLNGRRPRHHDKFVRLEGVDGLARTRAGFAKIPTGKTYALRNRRSVWIIPTRPNSLEHFASFPESLVGPCILAGCPLGGIVFDPFIGSGTVGAVAERLGRRWVGLDLRYQDLAAAQTRQRGLPFALEAS